MLKGLFVGGRETLSLGRISFWLIFILAVYFWLFRATGDFPPTLDNALVLILTYNLGSKAVGLAINVKSEEKEK